MSQLDLNEFRAILQDCAGEDERSDTVDDFADRDFTALGYDSLALLEVQSRIEQKFAISLPDNAVADAGTPARAVALINDRLTGEA